MNFTLAMTVMLVDDEEIIRTGIASMVPWSENGLKLKHIATNGQEAFDILQNDPVDIVITDIKMPIMDGLELIRRCAQQNIQSRFIMLTGFSDFEYARAAMKHGVHHYLLKPCSESEIIEACLDTVRKIEAASETLELARGASQNFLLNYIIYGNCPAGDLDYFGKIINPDNKSFRLVLFYCEEKDPFLGYAATNIAEELFAHKVLYRLTISAQIILFLCIGEKEALSQIAQEVAAHMQNLFQVEYVVSITDDCALSNLPQVYWQALENRSGYKRYQDSCVDKMIRIVEEHISNPDLSLKWIAHNKLYMNENYLSKLFLKTTGLKFSQHLTNQRINMAKVLLKQNPDIKMIAICQEVGLSNNPSYFSTLFKSQTGLTITEYRKSVSG